MSELSLDNCIWKKFNITDFFEISGTKTTPLLDLELKRETTDIYPYITTKSDDMGIDGYFNYYTEEGNVITVDSATDGNIHYQKNNFSASDHVEKLTPLFEMNEYVAFFIVSSFKFSTKSKFHYGYKFSQERIKRQTLMLPIDNENNPDFEFMENYIKQKIKENRTNFLNFLKEKRNELEYVDILPLDEKEWKSFKIVDIFPEHQRGKRLTKFDSFKGQIPYVSSTAKNNGIDDYIGNTENVRIYENCLTLANSGSVGSTFFHPYKFVASDHVTHLKNNELDKYSYLFIASLIKRVKERYNFNREINDKRLKKEIIVLPITDEEKPDYEYMKQYMINLEIKSLDKYINSFI